MFKLELESEFNHIGDSCEFDLPEKFLCQKNKNSKKALKLEKLIV